MKAALKAFASWKNTSIEERASLLFRAADLMRQRKMDYMAWLVFEVSKNWGEADADISETIDFLEFYAREALRFAKAATTRAIARRARHPQLHPTRRRRGYPSLEFPLCHHGRHDGRLHRQREYGDLETVQRLSHHRCEIHGTVGRSWPP